MKTVRLNIVAQVFSKLTSDGAIIPTCNGGPSLKKKKYIRLGCMDSVLCLPFRRIIKTNKHTNFVQFGIGFMDDSQGSDVFSESVDMFCDSPTNETYENVITNTKSALRMGCDIKSFSFSTCFTSLLHDCDMSITKSLDLIMELLSESSDRVSLNQLIEYINNTVELLHLLSNYLKNLIESVVLACHSFKTFPTTTGRILFAVFTHCKDSEAIYGKYLGVVEKQLKELFRMCHELQLIYLIILEKHFILDLMEMEERDIFIEALDINLQIGETVQRLDVKTMADQWKAFTSLCEKYSVHLCDTNIFYKSTKTLCSMIETNIKNAEETNGDEKMLMRSIKVTVFTFKILLKLCTIFKQSHVKNYEQIVDFLIFMFLNTSSYKELYGKSPQYLTLVNANLMSLMECLLKELMLDDKFLNCLTTYDIKKNGNSEQLGFTLVIVAAMKIQVKTDIENISNDIIKYRLIECVFRILPYCHVWFNIGLKFNVEPLSAQKKTVGLNDYLLVHTVSLIVTMNNKEYNLVEECMVNALLGTDCTSAVFSSNLWTLLSRFSPRELLLSQTLHLCTFYTTLETFVSFHNSPQKVHLAYTISKLFQTMKIEDRAKMYEMLPLDQNISIWSTLKIVFLPEDMRRTAENIVIEKLNLMLSDLSENGINCYEDMTNVIYLMNIASSLLISNDNLLLDSVVCTWLKLCPVENLTLVDRLETGTLWCIQFIEALSSLTCSIADMLCSRNEDLIKILHMISKLTQIKCLELKLIILDLLHKICTSKYYDGNVIIEDFLVQSINNIIQNEDNTILRNELFLLFNDNMDKHIVNKIITKVFLNNYQLKQWWNKLTKYRNKNNYIADKSILEISSNFEYRHKCIIGHIDAFKEIDQSDNVVEISQSRSNFDLVDIDTLFNTDNDTKPQCKRVKLNVNAVDEVITRLQADIMKLSKEKESITCEHKLKIKDLCTQLRNIVD